MLFSNVLRGAIRQGVISDYKILTVTVNDGHIRQLIADNRILNLNLSNLDEAEAQSAAAGIALKRAFKKHGIKHAISFHRSIARRVASGNRRTPSMACAIPARER